MFSGGSAMRVCKGTQQGHTWGMLQAAAHGKVIMAGFLKGLRPEVWVTRSVRCCLALHELR